MTRPLDPDEKWVFSCGAEEDKALACHASDPNSYIEQRCARCSSGQKRRVKKNDPEYDFQAVLDEEDDFMDQMIMPLTIGLSSLPATECGGWENL